VPEATRARKRLGRCRAVANNPKNLEFLYFHFYRFEFDLLLLAGEFVGGDPAIFLAEKGGGICSMNCAKLAASARTSSPFKPYLLHRRSRLASAS